MCAMEKYTEISISFVFLLIVTVSQVRIAGVCMLLQKEGSLLKLKRYGFSLLCLLINALHLLISSLAV